MNYQIYLDCESAPLGCDFKVPVTVNGAAIGGGGGAGVSSINGVAGAFNFTGAVSCASTTCNFTGGGGGGSGTVASGTALHFAWYSAAGTTVSSSANLDDGATTAGTITSQETLAAPGINVNGTGGIAMTGVGATLPAPVSGQGGIGIGPGSVPEYYSNGGAWTAIGSGGGGITGATANGGLVATSNTLGLLTTCSAGQVLEWNSPAWGCATVTGGGGGSGTVNPNNGVANAVAYYAAAGGSTTISPTTAGGPALTLIPQGIAFTPAGNDTTLVRPVPNVLLLGSTQGTDNAWFRNNSSCAVNAPVTGIGSSNMIVCQRSLPGMGFAWIVHCVVPWNFTAGSGNSTVTFTLYLQQLPTAPSLFATILTSGASSAVYGTATISTSANNNVVLTNSGLSASDTTTIYTAYFDGVINASSTAGNFGLYVNVGNSATMQVQAGAYCRVE